MPGMTTARGTLRPGLRRAERSAIVGGWALLARARSGAAGCRSGRARCAGRFPGCLVRDLRWQRCERQTRAGDLCPRIGQAGPLREFVDSFRGWAAEGDAVYQNSAAETGGMRYIRFVHDADCRITVLNVTVSPSGDDDFWSLTSELKWTKGFTDPDRKYLVFLDRNHPDICGQADVISWRNDPSADDPSPATNANNNTYGFAVIYNGCWSSNVTIAHELGHNFGAVQGNSPNHSMWDHCVDEWDVMCYDDSDGPRFPTPVRVPGLQPQRAAGLQPRRLLQHQSEARQLPGHALEHREQRRGWARAGRGSRSTRRRANTTAGSTPR